MSYRLIAACIISTAQHASPNVKGHMEPARAQDTNETTLVEIHSNFIILHLPTLTPLESLRVDVVNTYARTLNTLQGEKHRIQIVVFS